MSCAQCGQRVFSRPRPTSRRHDIQADSLLCMVCQHITTMTQSAYSSIEVNPTSQLRPRSAACALSRLRAPTPLQQPSTHGLLSVRGTCVLLRVSLRSAHL